MIRHVGSFVNIWVMAALAAGSQWVSGQRHASGVGERAETCEWSG